jgi:AbiV family abortive infection protein
MKKQETFTMSHSQIKSGIKKALLNSLTLAGYSKDILERGGNPSLSLGLYSFAIEEYGKAINLIKIASSKQKNYSVPYNLFGKGISHKINLKAAISELPKPCVGFETEIAFTATNPKKSKTLHESQGETKNNLKNSPEKFSVVDVLIGFNTQMDCFYLDWDEQQSKWNSPPKVQSQILTESITAFENSVNKKLDIEYHSK